MHGCVLCTRPTFPSHHLKRNQISHRESNHNSTKATLQENTTAVVDAYTHCGFHVSKIHADGAFKEFAQLNDKNVFQPVSANTLNHAQKKEALRAVNILKEKQLGDLKRRACANGSSQSSLVQKMTITCGRTHTFLGMDIVFNRDGTFSTTMKSYINKAIQEFGKDVSSPASTPGGKNLFGVDPESRAL
jgi:hypothetical protein